MKCPHCQVELADPAPKFCAACGLATGAGRKWAEEPPPPTIKCPECGCPVHTKRCHGCGERVRWPEGIEPGEGI